MGKTSMLKASVALLLIVLLFLCVAAFSHATTKTFAAHIDATVMPTAIVSVTLGPSPTSQPGPSPTPQPSPTVAPSPTPTATLAPTATPIPTVTSVPTAVPSPTVGMTPTVVVKPTVAVTATMVHATPVATQKAGAGPIPMPTQMPTVVPTQPTTAPVDITSKKTIAPTQSPLHNDSPMVPLVVGTLLTLCLGAGGFVGVRRVRTALLPAIDMKKQRKHSFAHSWQRVRTIPTTAVPPLYAQETMPFVPVPLQTESTASLPRVEIPPLAMADEDEGPKTGPHRRLGPVRLRKLTKIEPAVLVLPVEMQPLPTDIEDMSFLDDPLLQDTLRQYRQKGKKDM